MTTKLVLLRHGESTWNKENLFTGWTDVPLSEKGEREAIESGRLMASEGYAFDVAHTSVLRRAIDTLNLTLAEMGPGWIPVRRHWRLNERHYGALQGLNKKQTAAEHGEDQVFVWRRSYDIPPPPLDPSDERHAIHDDRYSWMPPELVPATEALRSTLRACAPWAGLWVGAETVVFGWGTLLEGRSDTHRVGRLEQEGGE